MASLTSPEVDLIIGLAGIVLPYLGIKEWRSRRTAKRDLANDTEKLVDSLNEQITYLRGELKQERRRRPRGANDPE